MGVTASKLIYDIVEIATSGGTPNEFPISNEQILYWIEQTRAMLIAQSLNKHDDINDTWIQYINCLQLEQVDSSLCCDAPSDCIVLRSTKKLPTTIDTWKDNWIISVTTIDGSSIPKSNPIKQKYQQFNKYIKNNRAWYIKDNYLYIINDKFLETVSITGLFETPSELSEFTDCSGNQCFSYDGNYPVSVSMASIITDIVIKTKVNPFLLTFPQDNSNNANAATPKQNSDNKQTQ